MEQSEKRKEVCSGGRGCEFKVSLQSEFWDYPEKTVQKLKSTNKKTQQGKLHINIEATPEENRAEMAAASKVCVCVMMVSCI